MANDAHVEELIPFYALGVLTPEEAKHVDEHIEHCASCRKLLSEQQAGAAALPLSVAPMEPSSHVKRELFERVEADLRGAPSTARVPGRDQEFPLRRRGIFDRLRSAAPALALASIVLFFAALAWGVSEHMQADRLRAENQALAAQVEERRAALAILSNPRTVAKDLQGTAVEPGAHGKLHADPSDTHAYIAVSGLKPLPAGRVYELWLIKGQSPVGVGTFTVDANGEGDLVVQAPDAIGTYQVSAVTDEPQGGSQLPTTDILMAAKL